MASTEQARWGADRLDAGSLCEVTGSAEQARWGPAHTLVVTSSISSAVSTCSIRLKTLVEGEPAKCRPTTLPLMLNTAEPLSPPAVYRVQSTWSARPTRPVPPPGFLYRSARR